MARYAWRGERAVLAEGQSETFGDEIAQPSMALVPPRLKHTGRRQGGAQRRSRPHNPLAVFLAAFLRSFASRIAFRMTILLGVTSTFSSSKM